MYKEVTETPAFCTPMSHCTKDQPILALILSFNNEGAEIFLNF